MMKMLVISNGHAKYYHLIWTVILETPPESSCSPWSLATGDTASERIRPHSSDHPPAIVQTARKTFELSSMCLPWRRVTAVPSTGLESIDGVITKFLQDKDSLHCIALFNVTQLYENLKTENGEGKNKQKQDRTLLTQQQWMRSKSKGKEKSHNTHTLTHFLFF